MPRINSRSSSYAILTSALPTAGAPNQVYRLAQQDGYYPPGDYVYLDGVWVLASVFGPALMTIGAGCDFDGVVVMGADYELLVDDTATIAPVAPTGWDRLGSIRLLVRNPGAETIIFTGITWRSSVPAAPESTLIVLTYDGSNWYGIAEEL